MNIKWLLASCLVGLILGVIGTLFGGNWVQPHLPEFMQHSMETVEGQVVRKQKEPDRLLLTVATPNGSTLASFTKQAGQVDLLVEEGDQMALSLPRYEPFVTDPIILHVQKRLDREVPSAVMIPPNLIPLTPPQPQNVEPFREQNGAQ